MNKKAIFILLLVVSLFTAGCVSKESTGAPVSNPPPAPGIEGKIPAPVVTATPGTTNSNQINIDRNDPILGPRINRWEEKGATFSSVNNLPQEIRIGSSDVFITDLKIDNKVSGLLENRGKKTLYVNFGKFTFTTKDYLFATELSVLYINDQRDIKRELKPGEKKSFSTINIKNPEEYKKLGGSPEDLKKIEQFIAQSSYVQIAGFSISDT